ncbi:DNA cytosine methyltransferase [Polaromonas sp. YR568]|uniref:DNA cytosine methyltransferase n=1 Tax=Polaromonas sp. YR568 TaxID=1855301 RepID=UPI00398BEEEA
MNVVEFFAGAGGLAIGAERAGFEHEVALDFNADACNTLRQNHKWNVIEQDVGSYQFDDLPLEPDLFAGGPPCQPFSTAGKHAADSDPRNRFPDVIRAIQRLRPKSFILENVSGLLRKTWSEYVNYLIHQLQEPELPIRNSESWYDHSSRLEDAYIGQIDVHRLRYQVHKHPVNAADYGVPQQRKRVIFIGFREDLGVRWALPPATHSEESLLYSKWITGDYWREHGLSRPICSDIELKKTMLALEQPELLKRERWRTVRDVLSDLGDPQIENGLGRRHGHDFIAGARSYVGHTGSALDYPAKTIKAGVNGIGGGENMLLREDGSVRYFTKLEMLRLQTFPDDYQLAGTRSSVIKQLGNAVPPHLAFLLTNSIKFALQRSVS